MRHRPTFRYQVLERTTHFRVVDGRILQDVRVRRLSDGVTGIIGVPA
jgi:hypothetical protein